jgi:hypothetical protein
MGSMTDPVFHVPAWEAGPPRAVAFVWRLRKGTKYAECRLWTHPKRAEIRVESGGEFIRSEAGHDPLALVERAMEWKTQFQEKGCR